MSLLQINNQAPRPHDPSAEGEDYAKGSSYLLWALIAAFVVISVGTAIFLLLNQPHPFATGEAAQVWAHPVHTINTPIDAAGVQSAGEVFDQVLVFAQIRVRNESKEPIVLKELLTNVELDDGIHSSYAATSTDYGRIFVAYPQLASLHSAPLLRDAVIQPGQVDEGMIVSAFRVTKEQWAARKNLNFTVQLKYHPDLTITPAGPITEQ
jgi:hypothetical protein